MAGKKNLVRNRGGAKMIKQFPWNREVTFDERNTTMLTPLLRCE